MNLKEKQKLESREKILKAASRLFREKGFQATGVDELMEKAGLTAGAFYAHFKSKQNLLEESLQYGFQKNRNLLLKGTEGLKGQSFLEAVVSNYVSELHRDNPQAGCPIPSVGPELPRNSKKSCEITSDYLNSLIEILAFHISGSESAKRQEALRLISQAVGGILLSRLVNPKLSKEVLQASKKVNHG